MFIKWKEENKPATAEQQEKYKHVAPVWASYNKPVDPAAHRLYAYLAESKRVEGKPRQKIITYLASIPVIYTDEEKSDEYAAFWYKATCSLLLAHINSRFYVDVIAGVGKRVKRPDRDTLVVILREGYETHPQWRKDYKAIEKVWERIYAYIDWLS